MEIIGIGLPGDLSKWLGKLRDLSPLWEMVRDGIDLSSVQWAAH